MSPQNLSDILGEHQRGVFNAQCYTCHEPVTVTAERTAEDTIQIDGGSLFRSPSDWMTDNAILAKCPACAAKNQDYGRPTEVYRRCCGYYRPTKNWNNAKQNEFELRKTYSIPGVTDGT